MNQKTNQKGFTIIEVVLVLAIAALIFLMIFIALPALQRGQRDSARKGDVGTVASAVNTYRSNNRNGLPPTGTATAFVGTGKYVDPAKLGQVTAVTVYAGAGAGPAAGSNDTIYVYNSAICSATNTATAKPGSKSAAVIVRTESGDGLYCQEV